MATISAAASEGVVNTQAPFTSGPWFVQQRAFALTVRADRGERSIPVAEIWLNGDSSNANADLVAAAPDLHAVAKAYEAWEADLILNNGWAGAEDLPTLTRAQYDRLLEIRAMRNFALAKATGTAPRADDALRSAQRE